MTAQRKSKQPSKSRAKTAAAEDTPQGAEAATASPLFTATVAIRWRDLDAFNHVNNSSYLTFLEEARLQWLQRVPGEWFGEHCMPVMAASQLNYRRPIAWPAQVAIELQAERVGTTSLTIGHRIVDAADPRTLYCDGNVVLVWMDPAAGKPVPLPAAIRDAIGRHD